MINSGNSDSGNNNSNSQINDARNTFNVRVARMSILGKTKKVQWDAKRRHRTI
tara:strand:- start:240 stop:398 length:159 start_codon:yes stop_codon:yes gene_type:complete